MGGHRSVQVVVLIRNVVRDYSGGRHFTLSRSAGEGFLCTDRCVVRCRPGVVSRNGRDNFAEQLSVWLGS